MKESSLPENSNFISTSHKVVDESKKQFKTNELDHTSTNSQKNLVNKIPISDNQQTVLSIGMFDRRINRIGFLLGFIYSLVPFFVASILELSTRSINLSTSFLASAVNGIAVILGLISIIVFIPISISLFMRRLHDINKSGGYAFLLLVPIIGQLLFLFLVFVPGDKQSNIFGMPVHSSNYWSNGTFRGAFQNVLRGAFCLEIGFVPAASVRL